MKLSIPQNVLSRLVDGEVVLLNLDSEAYFGLDEAGAEFWNAIQRDALFESGLQAVCDAFEVSREHASRDLLELVETLIAAGLLIQDE